MVFIVEHDKEHNTRVGEGETKYHGGWGYVLILGRGTTRGECQLAIRGEGAECQLRILGRLAD